MKIARFSVSRPIFTTMVTLIVVILGGISLWRLPIDLMPDVSFPTLTVSTSYENASPEEMEELVTRRVEEAVAAVPGVDELTSTSAEGISNVRVTFTWGTDLDVAANDIRDRLDRISDDLPEEAETPQLRKFDIASFPILILGVATQLDPLELRRLIDEQVKYRIERIPGVAVLDVWGGFEPEVRVQLDIEKIKALGLPLDGIIRSLREANLTVPAGTIERGHYDVTLRTPGEFKDLAELKETIVASRDGAPIVLDQIAAVIDTHREITRVIRINGEPGVRLAVRKQSATNTVEVAQDVLAEIERINLDYPQIDIVPISDSSEYIENSIDNVGRSVLYGGALAILVLLFFLRNVRSTLVIATAIPISIIATFSLVYFGGFTLNLMTLGGLALGVGMMVDSAIVVLENIFRLRQEKAMGSTDSAIHGAEEVTAAIIASTVTTLVIFLPLVFVQGMSGVLFRQLAYVVGFSLICSLVVALTLVPVLAAKLGGRDRNAALAASVTSGGRLFRALEGSYRDLLGLALRHRFLTSVGVLGAFVGSLFLYPLIGSEFMPKTDEGEVRISAEMEVGTRLDVVDRRMQRIEEKIEDLVPEARASVVSIGASSYRPGNAATGDISLSLVPIADRQRSSEDIANELREQIGAQPGMTIRTRTGTGLFVLRIAFGDGTEGVQVEVRGHGLEALDALSASVAEALGEVPGITDVRLSRETGVPQELLRIDRRRAADLGLSIAKVARMLETAIAGSQAGTFRRDGDDVRILVQLKDAELLALDEVLDLTILNDFGEQVVLRNVVSVEPRRGPIQIDRKNQQRIATVSANIADRDLGSVIADVEQRLKEIPRPSNYDVSIAGDWEERQEAFAELLISLVLSLVLVYMVMACLYESLLDPLVVMFSVPLAAIGILVMLFLTDTTFNVQSYIGCIMLGGIVVNNVILIVDQATRLRREDGLPIIEAVREAGRRRLRPILMTSLTTVLGLLPLALGLGEGAEAQAPLARAVIGGLFSSTLITLFIIPVVYSLLHRERQPA
ncbi:MAG: efflux RND transporter permease subunit [Planctomycetota bacterium]